MRLSSLQETTPWAMGVADDLQTIAHGVGSYKKTAKLKPQQSQLKKPALFKLTISHGNI